MITNFLFGGFIFVLIEYIINKINNPSLASIISMIPIGYLTTFLIKKRTTLTEYIRNIIFVVLCTLIITTLFYLCLKYMNINPMYITIAFILIWIIAQYLNYTFVITKY
jgi:hypothetical protein